MGEPRKVTAVAKFHDFSRASTSGHGWRVSEWHNNQSVDQLWMCSAIPHWDTSIPDVHN